MGFSRDRSGRLTFDQSGISALQYPALCREIADEFGLVALDEIVIGPDQMFGKFQRARQVIGLDWDIWMEFMIVAESEESETLVREIAEWFETTAQREK